MFCVWGTHHGIIHSLCNSCSWTFAMKYFDVKGNVLSLPRMQQWGCHAQSGWQMMGASDRAGFVLHGVTILHSNKHPGVCGTRTRVSQGVGAGSGALQSWDFSSQWRPVRLGMSGLRQPRARLLNQGKSPWILFKPNEEKWEHQKGSCSVGKSDKWEWIARSSPRTPKRARKTGSDLDV